MPFGRNAFALDGRGVTSIEYALIAAATVLATLALSPVAAYIMQPLQTIARALVN